jgi:hypothetical protein
MEGRGAMTEPLRQPRWVRALIIALAVAVVVGTIGSVLIALRLMQ